MSTADDQLLKNAYRVLADWKSVDTFDAAEKYDKLCKARERRKRDRSEANDQSTMRRTQ